MNSKLLFLLFTPVLLFTSCNETQFFEKEYLEASFGDGFEDPANPTFTDTSDPIDPVIPVPTQPSEPTEPVATTPTQPSEPTEPVATTPTQPNEPTEPVATTPTQPSEPTEPVATTPTQPSEPTEPVANICGDGKHVQEIIENFKQNSSKEQKLDILWVIDDSGSMRDEQEALAYNFELFINRFLTRDIDFKMGITTTDTRNQNNPFNGDLSKLTSQYAKDQPQAFTDYFKTKIQVGTRGSGREKGLVTSTYFFENQQDFVREDAHLVIIYVSDEEDQSSDSVSNYLSSLQSLKNEQGKLQTHSIVTYQRRSGTESVGTRYIEMANLTGGSNSSIHEDFYESLDQMGGKILDLLFSFSLSGQPLEDSVSVKINNNEDNSAWSFNDVTNNVEFGESSAPNEGSDIEVKYKQCVAAI